MSDNQLSFVVLLAGVVPGVLYLLLTVRLQRILQREYPSAWTSLGRPEVGSFSPRSAGRFIRFLWTREATQAHGVPFRKICWVWRALAVWLMLVFLGFAALALYATSFHVR